MEPCPEKAEGSWAFLLAFFDAVFWGSSTPLPWAVGGAENSSARQAHCKYHPALYSWQGGAPPALR